MLKNLSQLEAVVKGKSFKFICDCDSQIADAKEASFQFIKYFGQLEDAFKAQQEKAEQEAKASSLSASESPAALD